MSSEEISSQSFTLNNLSQCTLGLHTQVPSYKSSFCDLVQSTAPNISDFQMADNMSDKMSDTSSDKMSVRNLLITPPSTAEQPASHSFKNNDPNQEVPLVTQRLATGKLSACHFSDDNDSYEAKPLFSDESAIEKMSAFHSSDNVNGSKQEEPFVKEPPMWHKLAEADPQIHKDVEECKRAMSNINDDDIDAAYTLLQLSRQDLSMAANNDYMVTNGSTSDPTNTTEESSGNESSSSPASSSSGTIKIKLRFTSPKSQVAAATQSETYAPAKRRAKKPASRARVSSKRKREVNDDTSSVANKEPKRTAFDFVDNSKQFPECFAQTVKAFLNSKSENSSDFDAFDECHKLCPSEWTGYNAQEHAIAMRLGLTEATYKCQKYRFFVGAAMLSEQNLRLEKRKAVNGKDDKTNFINLNKTQLQIWGNIDANKLSIIFTHFQGFGWAPNMVVKGPGKEGRIMNSRYHSFYPADLRKALLNELKAFEATRVPDVSRRIVLAAQD
jgi:hypothetical protein